MPYQRRKEVVINEGQGDTIDDDTDEQTTTKYRGRNKGPTKIKSPFVPLTKMFPSKSGNSYTIFLNDQTRSKILNFLDGAKDNDLLGVSIDGDGGCRLYGIVNEKNI